MASSVLFRSLLLHAVAAFLLQPSMAATSQTIPEQQPGCSPLKSCGDLNITYPFWLEDPDHPPCGSPPFQLKCNASGAFLTHSMFQAYRVINIFPQNRSLHVVDENLPLAAGCPAPCFNLSLATTGLGAFAISRANSELRFLSKCDEALPDVLPGFRRLPCNGNDSFVGFGRRFGSSSIRYRAIPTGCLVAVVPVLPVPAADRHDYVACMRKGFLLGKRIASKQ